MTMDEAASLALERLLLRAYRHTCAALDAQHVILVQYQHSLRTTGSVRAEHMALPRRHRVTMMVPRMLKVTTS